MAAELLYVGLGLGHLLMMGRELNDMNQVIAVMIVIIVIGVVVDRLMGFFLLIFTLPFTQSKIAF
jgi:NitT/TauT family transport system permease protein